MQDDVSINKSSSSIVICTHVHIACVHVTAKDNLVIINVERKYKFVCLVRKTILFTWLFILFNKKSL